MSEVPILHEENGVVTYQGEVLIESRASYTGAEWSFNAAEPYAVTVALGSRERVARWMMSRELLLQGVDLAPGRMVGESDVKFHANMVRPDHFGMILAPKGVNTAWLQVPRIGVTALLNRSLELVPAGLEYFDIEPEAELMRMIVRQRHKDGKEPL